MKKKYIVLIPSPSLIKSSFVRYPKPAHPARTRPKRIFMPDPDSPDWPQVGLKISNETRFLAMTEIT